MRWTIALLLVFVPSAAMGQSQTTDCTRDYLGNLHCTTNQQPGINWGLLQPVDTTTRVQEGFEQGQRMMQQYQQQRALAEQQQALMEQQQILKDQQAQAAAAAAAAAAPQPAEQEALSRGHLSTGCRRVRTCFGQALQDCGR